MQSNTVLILFYQAVSFSQNKLHDKKNMFFMIKTSRKNEPVQIKAVTISQFS